MKYFIEVWNAKEQRWERETEAFQTATAAANNIYHRGLSKARVVKVKT